MPIQDYVIFDREDGENDVEEIGSLFTRISPRHPVIPHELFLSIGEAVWPTISLEIVTFVLEVQCAEIQYLLITDENLNEELASLKFK